MLRWLRPLGWLLLLGGFVVFVIMTIHTVVLWILWYGKYVHQGLAHIPEGGAVPRDEVVQMLDRLIHEARGFIFARVPLTALAMFVGGILLSLRVKPKNDVE